MTTKLFKYFPRVMPTHVWQVFVVIIFLSGAVNSASARNLNYLIACDTNTSGIVQSVRSDCSIMNALVTAIRSTTQMEVKNRFMLTGSDLTHVTFNDAINIIVENSNDDDLIIFYFSGMGKTMNDGKKWPAMQIPDEVGGYVPVSFAITSERLQDKVKDNGLLLSLADISNSNAEPKILKNFGNAWPVRPELVDNYKALFQNHVGVIQGTAASFGESAFRTNNGGRFTDSFRFSLSNRLESSPPVSDSVFVWGRIAEGTTFFTSNSTNNRQNPIFEIQNSNGEALYKSDLNTHINILVDEITSHLDTIEDLQQKLELMTLRYQLMTLELGETAEEKAEALNTLKTTLEPVADFESTSAVLTTIDAYLDFLASQEARSDE